MRRCILNTLKDRFETDMPGNCLIFPVSNEDKIYDYQIEMIVRNPSPRILPLEKRRINNQIRLYYRTASLIPLKRYLSGIVLERADFLNILESIIGCLADCKRYFLYECCFLLDSEYIYVHPGTKAVSLLYIPLETGAEATVQLRGLVNELSTALRLDGCSDDQVFNKKISELLNGDSYHLAELARLIKELKYPRGQVRTELSKPVQKPFILDPVDGIPADLEQTGKEKKERSLGAQKIYMFLNKIFGNSSLGKNKLKEKKPEEWQVLLTSTLAKENNVIRGVLEKNQIILQNRTKDL